MKTKDNVLNKRRTHTKKNDSENRIEIMVIDYGEMEQAGS